MISKEQLELSREVDATQIPSGIPHKLAAGTKVRLMQALGGSYTVMTDFGYMVRIDAKDADALGLTPSAAAAAEAPQEFSEKLVWDLLKTVYDPEIPVNVVDLGLIYDCKVTPTAEGGNTVDIKMTLTAPGCGMGPAIAHDAQSKILSIDGVDEADVQLVWDPPWNQNMISEAGRMKLGMI
jgi:probable FeS assembly SUF system protein SufT